jgi:hypothetical protein
MYMSRSVATPVSLPFSTTGRMPQSVSHIRPAAAANVLSGVQVRGSGVMMSLIYMVPPQEQCQTAPITCVFRLSSSSLAHVAARLNSRLLARAADRHCPSVRHAMRRQDSLPDAGGNMTPSAHPATAAATAAPAMVSANFVRDMTTPFSGHTDLLDQ